jgi:hypothetical protein
MDAGPAIAAGAPLQRRSGALDTGVAGVRPNQTDTGRRRSTLIDARSTGDFGARRRERIAAWRVGPAGNRHVRPSGRSATRDARIGRKLCAAFRIPAILPPESPAKHLPSASRVSIVDGIVPGNRSFRRGAMTGPSAGCSRVPASAAMAATGKDLLLARTRRSAARSRLVGSRKLCSSADILLCLRVSGAWKGRGVGPPPWRALIPALRIWTKAAQGAWKCCIRPVTRGHASGTGLRPASAIREAPPRSARPGGTGPSWWGRSVRATSRTAVAPRGAGRAPDREIRLSACVDEPVRRSLLRRATSAFALRIRRHSIHPSVRRSARAALSGLASTRWTGRAVKSRGRPARCSSSRPRW